MLRGVLESVQRGIRGALEGLPLAMGSSKQTSTVPLVGKVGTGLEVGVEVGCSLLLLVPPPPGATTATGEEVGLEVG